MDELPEYRPAWLAVLRRPHGDNLLMRTQCRVLGGEATNLDRRVARTLMLAVAAATATLSIATAATALIIR